MQSVTNRTAFCANSQGHRSTIGIWPSGHPFPVAGQLRCAGPWASGASPRPPSWVASVGTSRVDV